MNDTLQSFALQVNGAKGIVCSSPESQPVLSGQGQDGEKFRRSYCVIHGRPGWRIFPSYPQTRFIWLIRSWLELQSSARVSWTTSKPAHARSQFGGLAARWALHTVVAKLSGAFHSHEKMKEGRTIVWEGGIERRKKRKGRLKRGISEPGGAMYPLRRRPGSRKREREERIR